MGQVLPSNVASTSDGASFRATDLELEGQDDVGLAKGRPVRLVFLGPLVGARSSAAKRRCR